MIPDENELKRLPYANMSLSVIKDQQEKVAAQQKTIETLKMLQKAGFNAKAPPSDYGDEGYENVS